MITLSLFMTQTHSLLLNLELNFVCSYEIFGVASDNTNSGPFLCPNVETK